MRKKTWLSWSSGKDSAWTLHVLRQSDEHEVAGIFTTINSAFDRVAMHAVRVDLLRRQAQAVGLPLYLIEIPYPCSNEQYAAVMSDFVVRAQGEGVQCMAFGDLYLEDIRRYREERMQGTGIEPIFPLWGRPTRALLQEMLAGGLRARLTCVDPRVACGVRRVRADDGVAGAHAADHRPVRRERGVPFLRVRWADVRAGARYRDG